MTATIPDVGLLKDAQDATLSLMAILEGNVLPTRDQVTSAVLWARIATAKLTEYECQMTLTSRKHETTTH